jgi:Fe-Mn family superoxide dismutase
MQAKVKHHKCDMSQKDRDLANDFIKFLQKKYPLKKDVTIIFTGERYGSMSSGSRTKDSELKILTKGRMNRDIFRTLAHEWVHEWQMSVKGKKPTGDIGGPIEDEANAEAGSVLKKFEKAFPDKEEMMYENINKKINLLKEDILITEKQNIREDFLLEMKKIGIEKLPYSYSAMKQFVDPETMDIHYNKHYKGYVKKLNDALSKKNYKDVDLEDIIKSISKYDTKVRNNAGGAFNHALFWKMLSPKKQIPKGEIFNRITKQYGNIKKMKDEFNEVAKERFGSGWVWLVLTKTNRLKIMSTPNQDNPLMNIIKDGGYPLIGLDLWEHAYYLRYRNKRDEYIKKFWNHINWEFVNELYTSKTKKSLNESSPKLVFESELKTNDRLYDLCQRSKKRKIENSPYCRLLEFRNTIKDKYVVDLINKSVLELDNFYRMKNVGTFPKIIELSLINMEKTADFLKLVSEFIKDKDYSDDETRKILLKQKNTTKVPENLDDLLAYGREKEYSKYEKRFVGKHFNFKPTRLQLNYSCGDDAKEKLIDTLLKVHNKQQTLEFMFFRITGCLVNSFRSGSYYIKADLEVHKDLTDTDGNVIFPSGSNFEVKKMDPFIDSYLSEFFSIFKQSKNITQKELIGDLYNQLIDKIYKWLINNKAANEYLNKVKSQISGMIYEGDFIVPMEYIQLYWSDKGQRGCDEKRLSIRFRIKPEFNEIVGYKYVDEDVLEVKKIPVPKISNGGNNERKIVNCQ